jgi:RND family efflux transporter MFP subunit
MRTAIVSPFDGLVIRRFHDPGDTVAVGATVLRVVATDTLWVRAWVDEGALGTLREGQPAQVTFPGAPGRVYRGKVDRIGREADRQTHELLVDVVMETLPERIAIGQRADVRIAVDRAADVLRLPIAFVRRDGAATSAYVDRGGRIQPVPIVLGRSDREWTEVTAGLTDADTVLASPAPGAPLAPGRRWRAVAAR